MRTLLRANASRTSNVRMHVAGRHFRKQHHLHVTIPLDRHAQIGVGRLDRPAELAPDVQFPTGVEARRPDVGRLRQRQVRHCRQLGMRVIQSPAAAAETGCRPRCPLGPGFQNARPGRPQIEVLPHRRFDQTIERRIAQHCPPAQSSAGALVDPLGLVGVDVRRRARLGGGHNWARPSNRCATTGWEWCGSRRAASDPTSPGPEPARGARGARQRARRTGRSAVRPGGDKRRALGAPRGAASRASFHGDPAIPPQTGGVAGAAGPEFLSAVRALPIHWSAVADKAR